VPIRGRRKEYAKTMRKAAEIKYLTWLWGGERSIVENNNIPLYSLSNLIN
jgi:hypothetical protein